MKLKIIDTVWKIRLLTPTQFNKEHGKEHKTSGGITDTGKKIVDFRTDETEEVDVIVRHETFHMYFDSLLLDSADLTMEQVEEVTASLLGKYGEEYIKNARKITKWLKKELQKENK